MKRAICLLLLAAGCGREAVPTEPTRGPQTIASIDAAHAEDKARRDEAAKNDPRLPVAELSGVELWTEYGGNVIAADAKYKGKYVKITSDVASISENSKGEYSLGLLLQHSRLGGFASIVCTIAKGHEAEFADVKENTRVTITARVKRKFRVPAVYEGYVIELDDARIATPARQDSGKANP